MTSVNGVLSQQSLLLTYAIDGREKGLIARAAQGSPTSRTSSILTNFSVEFSTAFDSR